MFRSCRSSILATLAICASFSISGIAAAVVLAPNTGFKAFEPTNSGTVHPAATVSSPADSLASASVDVLGGRSSAGVDVSLLLIDSTTRPRADVARAPQAGFGTDVQGAGASR